MRGVLMVLRAVLTLLLCGGLGLIGLAVWQLHAGPTQVELMLGRFVAGIALVHVWAVGVPALERLKRRAVPARR